MSVIFDDPARILSVDGDEVRVVRASTRPFRQRRFDAEIGIGWITVFIGNGRLLYRCVCHVPNMGAGLGRGEVRRADVATAIHPHRRELGARDPAADGGAGDPGAPGGCRSCWDDPDDLAKFGAQA